MKYESPVVESDEALVDSKERLVLARNAPPPQQKPRARPGWLERINNYYWVQNMVRIHEELPLWIIHWDGKKQLDWMYLNETVGQIQPFHFEIYYGKEGKRDAYYADIMKRVGESGKFEVGELHGFNDFFFPMPADPRGKTFLFGGQFLTEPLDWDGIAWRWR